MAECFVTLAASSPKLPLSQARMRRARISPSCLETVVGLMQKFSLWL